MDNMQYRFGEFCRVCLRQNIDLIYLKSEDNDLITYFEKLQNVNNGSIIDNDIFPNWICTKCKNHLCYCYKFYQKCQKAVTVLQECLEQIKQANHGDNTTKFYITNIKDVETRTTIEDDPLDIKEESINEEEQFTIKIKQEIEEFNELPTEKNCLQIKIEPGLDLLKFETNDTNLDSQNLETNILESLLVPKLDQNKSRSKNLDRKKRVVKSKNLPQNKTRTSVRNINNLDPPVLEPNPLTFIKNLDQNPPLLEPFDLPKNSSKRIINAPKKLDPSYVSTRSKTPKLELDPLELDPQDIKNTSDDLGFKYSKKKVPSKRRDRNKLLYTCKVCYKTFTQKTTLLTHAIYHDTYNKYNCSVCGTSFRYKEFFLKHLEIHANFPVDCQICKQSFKDNKLLNKHYKKHIKCDKESLKLTEDDDDKQTVECNMCYLPFKGKKALVGHMRAHFD